VCVCVCVCVHVCVRVCVHVCVCVYSIHMHVSKMEVWESLKVYLKTVCAVVENAVAYFDCIVSIIELKIL